MSWNFCRALFVAGVMASAARCGAAAPLQGSVSVAAVSDYVYRGEQLGGTTLQSTLDAHTPSLDFGVTASLPRHHQGAAEPGTEFDLYGSRTIELSKRIAVIPGFTVYSFPNAPENAGHDRTRFEPYLAISYTLAGIRFVPACYYDLNRRGPTYELAAAMALPLAKLGSELDLAVAAGGYVFRDAYNAPGPRIKRTGTYCSASATLPFQLTAANKVSVGLSFGATVHSAVDGGGDARRQDALATHRLAAQISYTYSF